MSALEDLELYGILLDEEWELLAQVTTDLGEEASAVRMEVRRWLAGREKAAAEAAMPSFREAIAQEIEALPAPHLLSDTAQSGYLFGRDDSASLVRGGTP